MESQEIFLTHCSAVAAFFVGSLLGIVTATFIIFYSLFFFFPQRSAKLLTQALLSVQQLSSLKMNKSLIYLILI